MCCYLQAALNIDNSVSRIGLYGLQSEKLWCLSHTETLHLWEWVAACDEESSGQHIVVPLSLQHSCAQVSKPTLLLNSFLPAGQTGCVNGCIDCFVSDLV